MLDEERVCDLHEHEVRRDRPHEPADRASTPFARLLVTRAKRPHQGARVEDRERANESPGRGG